MTRILIALTCILFFGTAAQAQAPQAFSYQAVIRDSGGGPLADQTVIVRIGIEANSIGGTLMWEEEHVVVTDNFGLFNIEIGQGANTGGGNSPTFDLINWGIAAYFLKVEVDPGDGTYELLGSTQLISVPYALYANRAGNIDEALITDFSFDNDSLIIEEAGIEHVLDIGPMLEEALVGESINLVQLVDDQLNIVEGDDPFVVDLSSYEDGEWISSEDAVYNTDQLVGIGTSTPSSQFHSEGSVAFGITSLLGPVNATLDNTHHIVLANVTSGDVSLTLPEASTCPGRVYKVKRFGDTPLSSDVSLVASGADEIDGETSYVMTGFEGKVLELISDGGNWYIISSHIIE